MPKGDPPLDTSWKFNESWASNVTLLSGAAAGVIGSSAVMRAIFGDAAESATALSVVGAAIAAGLVAAGGVAVLGMKTEGGKYLTVGGVLAGSA